jgi:hypothetical protein
LSLPVHCDPALSEEAEVLAREIAGPGTDAETHELARRVAEAEVDLRRVRHARHRLLSGALSDPYYESRADTRMKVALLCHALRGREIPDLENFVITTPEGPQKFATVLLEEAKKLRSMDRYERRALARRKCAIRDFDEHRASRESKYPRQGRDLNEGPAQSPWSGSLKRPLLRSFRID